VWIAPANNISNQLGSASVGLFFMLSAYLFAGKVLPGARRFDTAEFFRHRVARIVPVYVVAFIFSIAITFALRPAIVSPIGDLLTGLGRWASFGFWLPRDVNGVPLSGALMSVSWSLFYEWILYALLVPIAYLCRATGRSWPAYLVLFVASIWDRHFSLFIFGLIAAQMPRVRSPLWVVAAAIATTILLIKYHDTTSWRQAALLFPLFVVVAHGLPAARILNSRTLQYLGAISYDIYLLQIPVLFALGKLGFDSVIRPGGITSIAIGLPACFITTIVISSVSHTQVEQRVERWVKRSKRTISPTDDHQGPRPLKVGSLARVFK
jgi:peptidoglycan/LPS O-acetylase OafA/YrhL